MSVLFDAPWALVGIALIASGLWAVRQRWRALPKAERLAVLGRAGALALICLALAGPRLSSGASERFVYFLVDRSASVGTELSKLSQLVQALAQPTERTFYGLISFGAEPMIETGFAPTLSGFQTEPDPTATDIAQAIQLALETFPRRGRREIVLFTDGQATKGDLAAVVARARREGVPIHIWPLGGDLSEVWISDLELPEEVPVGVPFSIRLQLGATTQGQGTVLLYRNNELIHTAPVEYTPGVQEVRLHDTLKTPGAFTYRVYLKASPDRLTENNELYGVTSVRGGPQVLVIERSLGESTVAHLVRSAGFSFDQKRLSDLATLPLAEYKVIILNNVPLGQLTKRERQALKNFVGDLGGGLWVIQGRAAVMDLEEQTPQELAELEELLPVSYLAPEPYEIPALALVFVMDRSGSMGDPAGGVPKIEILKRAALRSLEVLDPEDWVGLIAFDTDFEWIVPLKPLGDRRDFQSSIQRLSANGGTDLYFALKAAFETLERQRAKVKHILVFTDGHNNTKREREYRELYKRFAQSAVRVSVLGIDRAPNEEFLKELAEAGRGRYQRVQEFTDLPVFSLREVRRIARLRWIEGQTPLKTLAPPAPPPVAGYVLTHERIGAQTVLTTDPEENPLLAFTHYGLGRVAVLNTDLEGEGAPQWLSWSGLSELFAQTLTQLYRSPMRHGELSVHIAVHDHDLEIIADMRQGDRWISDATLLGQLTGPLRQEFLFSPIAPGRYRAQLGRPPQGQYILRVAAQRADQLISEITKPLVIPYAHEYRRVGLNSEFVQEITRATGGQVLERLSLPPPSGKIAQESFTELWPWALVLALALFIIDLALRKLWWLVER
jgi:Ca-activated chloride channel family protein